MGLVRGCGRHRDPGWPEGPPEVFRQRRDPQVADGRETSGWAAGGILFAGLMMIMVGIWQALQGLIANFLWLPYYPFWSMLIIAVDIFVIWAIAAHGRKVAA
jgi:hypothetical protein